MYDYIEKKHAITILMTPNLANGARSDMKHRGNCE